MKQKYIANSYKSLSLETASPGKIILMLYDGALRFMGIALNAFQEPNMRVRNETIHNNIVKTQDILHELLGSLDLSVAGDFPSTLFELYDYMSRRLQRANYEKNAEMIEEVRQLLKEIRDAWFRMLTHHSQKV